MSYTYALCIYCVEVAAFVNLPSIVTEDGRDVGDYMINAVVQMQIAVVATRVCSDDKTITWNGMLVCLDSFLQQICNFDHCPKEDNTNRYVSNHLYWHALKKVYEFHFQCKYTNIYIQ